MQTMARCRRPELHRLARFAVVAFFAITFLQSGLNKVFDSEGNLGFMREHFKNAPLLARQCDDAVLDADVARGPRRTLLRARHPDLQLRLRRLLRALGTALRDAVAAVAAVRAAPRAGLRRAATVATYFAIVMLGLLVSAFGRWGRGAALPPPRGKSRAESPFPARWRSAARLRLRQRAGADRRVRYFSSSSRIE